METNRLTRRRVLQGSGSLTLLGLAGCDAPTGQPTDEPAGGEGHSDDHAGHGDSPHGHEQVGEPKATREVLVNTARNGDNTEYHFDPHVTWVDVGGTVTWTLESGSHTATAYHPGNDQPRLVPEGTDAWDSEMLSEEGETFEHTFETEGVYHYYCEPHETFGMLATVIVGDPDLDEQTALQRVPEEKPEEVRGKLEELNEICHSILDGPHEEETTEHGDEEQEHHETETAEHGDEEEKHHSSQTTTTS
ncbi:cupredoxin domain-containing protein [Halapricum hydrolyticum]|uniref:cupredoxin domain-containing protein n=1 Tax=Halapricum hydrolyticum TaxID=2979991 RepID=UPI0028F6C801|nr:plastocyanin/azurin family copper-binding protein [Halapricum hydrolyticum]